MLTLLVRFRAVAIDDRGVWIDEDEAIGAVDDDRGAIGNNEQLLTGAHDCWYPEGASEDRAV